MALLPPNLIWFRAASNGTGDFVVASALTGYRAPVDAEPAMVNGQTYPYVASSDDESQKAYGVGTWSEGTSTLVRGSEQFIPSGFAGNFSAAPKVMLTPLTASFLDASVNTLTVADEAYDATDWNGDLTVPTKNAVRDKIESMSPGGGLTTLDVTAVGGVFTIASLRGVGQVNLTTDSNGPCSLDIAEYPYSGQVVNFRVAGLGDPADTVVISGLSFMLFGFSATLANVDESIALQFVEKNAGNRWHVVNPKNEVVIRCDDEPNTTLAFLAPGANQPFQETELVDATEFGPFSGAVEIRVPSGGSPATGVVFAGAGDWTGLPFPVLMTRNNSDEAISLDPSNFVDLAGATPSDITFGSEGDSLSLTPSNGSVWLILGASPGVVTM